MKRVEAFLNIYDSEKTVASYKTFLKTFFNHIYGERDLEEQAERYFNEERDYKRDIQSLLAAVREDKSPLTVKAMFSALRTFLIENDVELPEKFWRRLRRRIKGSKAVSEEKLPDNEEIRRILVFVGHCYCSSSSSRCLSAF